MRVLDRRGGRTLDDAECNSGRSRQLESDADITDARASNRCRSSLAALNLSKDRPC